MGEARKDRPASVFLQWKGTDACLDFSCPCGYSGHYDGPFAYALRCGACKRVWIQPYEFDLAADDGTYEASGAAIEEVND